MASVSSAARVDGVDLQGMVGASTAFARPPLQPSSAPVARDSEAQARISPAGKLRGATAALVDAAQRLARPQTWSATKASSSNEEVVSAAASNAKAGDYSVKVSTLAAAQATASATFNSLSTVIGLGTLNIELGSWNTTQTAFAMNPNWPKAAVTTGPKDTSLELIRDKINAAGIGVIATVLQDATGSRLVLRSTSTGSANGFKVDAQPAAGASPDTAQALAALGFDPGANPQGASLTQAAQDARVAINNRTVQSASNVIDDEASGLQLKLRSASDEAVTIRVRPDTESVVQGVQTFVSAYNGMVEQLDGTEVDDAARGAAQAMQGRVAALLQADQAPSPLATALSDAGLAMSQGRLNLDQDRFEQAFLAQPQAVAALFADASPSNGGLIDRLSDMLTEPVSAASQDIPAAESPTLSDAGRVFRQRLLEQYSQPLPAEPAPSTGDESEQPAALPENVA